MPDEDKNFGPSFRFGFSNIMALSEKDLFYIARASPI